MRSGSQGFPSGRIWGGAEQNPRTPHRASGVIDDAIHTRMKREQEIHERLREDRRAREEQRLHAEAAAATRQNPTRHPPIELSADVALVETSDVGFECGMHAVGPKIDKSPFEDCVQCHIRDKKAGGATEKVAEREAGREAEREAGREAEREAGSEAGREAERAAERAADNVAGRPERTAALEDLHSTEDQAPQRESDGQEWQPARSHREKRKLREKLGGGGGRPRVLDRIDKTSEKSSENPPGKSSEGIVSSFIRTVRGFGSLEQECEHWKTQYDDMKKSYGDLNRYCQKQGAQIEDLKGKLTREKDESRRLQEECASIIRSREELKNRYHLNLRLYDDAERRVINLQKDIVTATEAHHKERDQLKTQIDELYTSHIRSVNTVGTGLDPISGDAISKKFTDLSDEIFSWCRRAFKGKTDVVRLDELEPFALEVGLDRLLDARTYDTNTIPYSRLIETITWGYIERSIFSVWFPGMVPTYLEPICTLQDWISAGDKSAQKERREYWRAYTCSLLFQNKDVADSLLAVDAYQTILANFYELVQREKKELPESQSEALRERLRKAMRLAAELRCQRGAYEIDDNIHLGEPYDETRMDDVGFTEEAYETPVVLCILSKGCVRRPFAGSDSVDSRVYKARVLVEEARR